MDFRWVFESIGGDENEMIFGPLMVHSQLIVVRLPIFMGLLMDRIQYGDHIMDQKLVVIDHSIQSLDSRLP